MFKFLFVLVAIFATALSFTPQASRSAAPASMKMMFGMGKKTTTTNYKVGEGSANKGTYIPDGLTKAQYDAKLAQEAAAKAKKQAKFPKGKEAETLTEWMDKEAKKGNTGKGLLMKGHRLVKAKYDEWYTDISPV